MKKFIIYSSVDGQTLKICQRLQNNFSHSPMESISNIKIGDLKNFDHISIGASVRYGDHSKNLYKFIKNNKSLLESKRTTFFSVNVTARKIEKNKPSTNPYIKKFLKKTEWLPDKIGVFAGKIDFPNYGFIDKNIIKLIMWITKGPTDTSKSYDFTDWKEVDLFSKDIDLI